ncbi:MAG: signal peptidase I [Chlorobi bacterium]|nr:signal peptidase I [Chlorobiota bacterium]
MNKTFNKPTSFSASMLLGEQFLNEGKILKITAGGFSMFPFIRRGDIVYIKKINNEYLKIGDVVVFKTNLKFIAHRLIKINFKNSEAVYTCKGDSMIKYDNPINKGQIVGKVFGISRNNRYINFESKKAVQRARFIRFISPITGYLFWLTRKMYFYVRNRSDKFFKPKK